MKYSKKSLGQNFLIDSNIIKKIVNLTEISNKNILEIGPGKGALTDKILQNNPKSLLLVEKDNILCDNLREKYAGNKKILIINKDILKFNIKDNIKKNTIIFGNLPYNISSQILVKIIRLPLSTSYTGLILMFQKEMAERILGKYGSSKYGRLSILANYKLKIIDRFNVSPNCFFPKPKIDSTVLFLTPKNNKQKILKLENLEKVTNILFSNKRKMINKNIKKILDNLKIKKIKNLDLEARPSELKPEKYYEITQLYEER